MIRRLQAKPMNEQTHFLRKKVGFRGSCLKNIRETSSRIRQSETFYAALFDPIRRRSSAVNCLDAIFRS